jgi:hypothetical protein
MKQIAVITLVVLTLISCEDDEVKVPVHVALHHQFEEDDVVVKIDNVPLIDGVASTNPSLGVSYVNGKHDVVRKLTMGPHKIQVQVNRSVVQTTEFTVTKLVYIAISYDPATSKISFFYSDEPFIYD